MICPNCGIEYQEGVTECADCEVDLIENITYSEKNTFAAKLTAKGITLLKFGICLMFFSISQFILAIIIYEFYIIYARNNGGVGSLSVLDNIHPVIWFLSIFELIMSLVVISWSTKQTK